MERMLERLKQGQQFCGYDNLDEELHELSVMTGGDNYYEPFSINGGYKAYEQDASEYMEAYSETELETARETAQEIRQILAENTDGEGKYRNIQTSYFKNHVWLSACPFLYL